MIYLYEGKIGDGKSYHVVRNELLPAIRAGRRVYTNIDIGAEHIRNMEIHCGLEVGTARIDRVDGKNNWRALLQLDDDDKEGVSLRVAQRSLIIVDESQMIWDAREFKETPKGFLTFLEYHRHFGLDVVFITQNVKRLDSAARGLANELLQVKNLKMLSSVLGDRYVIHHRQKPGDPIVASSSGRFDPLYFRFYRSHRDGGMRTHASMTGISWKYYGIVLALLVFAGIRIAQRGVIPVPAGLDSKAPVQALGASPAKPAPVDLGAMDKLKDAVAARVEDGCRMVARRGYGKFTMGGVTEVVFKPFEEKVCPVVSVAQASGGSGGFFGSGQGKIAAPSFDVRGGGRR